MPAMTARRLLLCVAALAGLMLTVGVDAYGREATSQVTELDQILRVHPEYPVPNEPNMLFYIERSANSNTVIYAANLDARGRINPDAPVNAYWRWYNVDGHKKPLILIERMLAYGITSVTHGGPHGVISFKVAAVPERVIVVDLDAEGHPEALMRIGGRWTKLVYIYLQVDDSGLLPKVPALDIFAIDKLTGRPLREHIIPH
jgi:hypothetical protein